MSGVMSSRKPANVFLVTHKCGNNYLAKTVGRHSSKLENTSFEQISNKELPSVKEFSSNFVNIRARHYLPSDITELLRLVDPSRSKFFLFTRHPASFFRSATTYHLRGPEEWAKSVPIPKLNNKTLYDSLHALDNYQDQLILSMQYWGEIVGVIRRWSSLLDYFKNSGLIFRQIKCEDLWMHGGSSFFDELASVLSHDGFAIDKQVLMAESPQLLSQLPSHSTGEFRKSYYNEFGDKSLDFYLERYLASEIKLGYRDL